MNDQTTVFQSLISDIGESAKVALAAANQVTVYPGGATFSTIQAAIDSIPDQSGPNSYSVLVGPGTYNEQVTLKPWVMLIGGAPEDVTISYPAARLQTFAVLYGAAHSGVSGITVQCDGQTWGDYATALALTDATGFNASGCVFSAGDKGNDGININAVQVDLWAETGSTPLFAQCRILAEATTPNSVATGLNMWNLANLKAIDFCVFSATGGMQSFAAIAEAKVTALFQEAKIIGDQWAIFLPQSQGNVTAENCVIQGTVSQGVIIKNDADTAMPEMREAREEDAVIRIEAKE